MILLVLRGGTLKQRKGHSCFILLFLGFQDSRQPVSHIHHCLFTFFFLKVGHPWCTSFVMTSHTSWKTANYDWSGTNVKSSHSKNVWLYNLLNGPSEHLNIQIWYCVVWTRHKSFSNHTWDSVVLSSLSVCWLDNSTVLQLIKFSFNQIHPKTSTFNQFTNIQPVIHPAAPPACASLFWTSCYQILMITIGFAYKRCI